MRGCEAGKQAERLRLPIGVRIVRSSGEHTLIERGIGCGKSGDVERRLCECGVEGIVWPARGGKEAAGQALRFGKNGGIVGVAEEFKEEGTTLLEVDGVDLFRGTEGGEDRGKLGGRAAESRGRSEGVAIMVWS